MSTVPSRPLSYLLSADNCAPLFPCLYPEARGEDTLGWSLFVSGAASCTVKVTRILTGIRICAASPAGGAGRDERSGFCVNSY